MTLLLGVFLAAKHLVEDTQQLILRKRHGVGVGQTWQQSTLVLLVVEQHLLGVSAGHRELATHDPVLDRNGHRQLRCHSSSAHQGHSALNESAEDGEEATATTFNG